MNCEQSKLTVHQAFQLNGEGKKGSSLRSWNGETLEVSDNSRNLVPRDSHNHRPNSLDSPF